MDEWIIAVGKHEGFIRAKDWVKAQKLKDEIYDKYNRPHRATNALLAGLIYCPLCGKRLNIVSESNRFTNGKPRFKYACPNAVRKGSCTFQALRGVELDEYNVKELSAMSNEDNRYVKELRTLTDKLVASDKNERDVASLKKEIDKLEKDILSQVKNLRNATDVTKTYIQADIDSMAGDIAEKKKLLAKLDNAEKAKAEQVNDLKELFYTLTNFEELVDGKEPEVIISTIRTVVERVIVTQEGEESKVNIKLKGNVKESYDDFFDCSDALIDAGSGSDELCDSEGCRKYCTQQIRA